MLAEQRAVVQSAIDLVQESMRNNDASHDLRHVKRVLGNARKLMDLEGVTEQCDAFVVECGAVLHDIRDSKYSGNESSDVAIDAFFDALPAEAKSCVTPEQIEHVKSTVRTCSFSTELKARDAGEVPELSIEAKIVQDADRLDALGALGIARCFCFSGAHKDGEPLVTQLNWNGDDINSVECLPSYSEYKATREESVVDHFRDKLLLLPLLMKTREGKKEALKRRESLLSFLDTLRGELEFAGIGAPAILHSTT
ncbi:MAG: hypothetical protein MHM6MM_004185 [Cercozoa sp. M6MM]